MGDPLEEAGRGTEPTEGCKIVKDPMFTCTKHRVKHRTEKVDLLWRHSSQIWHRIGTWSWNQLRSQQHSSAPPLASQFRLLALKREPGLGDGLLWRPGVWIWWECWAGGSWTACCSAHPASFCQPAAVEAD